LLTVAGLLAAIAAGGCRKTVTLAIVNLAKPKAFSAEKPIQLSPDSLDFGFLLG
jgi:hypothetical protein